MKKLLNIFVFSILFSSQVFAATNQATGRQIATNTLTDNNLANGSVGTLELSDNGVAPSDIKHADTATDEYCITYESTNDQFEYQPCSSSSFDNIILDVAHRAIADASDNATVSDVIVAYTSLSATRVLTLPAAATATQGRIYFIKDESGSASESVKITVDGLLTETIDGVSSIDITAPRGVLRVYTNGTNWFTL